MFRLLDPRSKITQNYKKWSKIHQQFFKKMFKFLDPRCKITSKIMTFRWKYRLIFSNKLFKLLDPWCKITQKSWFSGRKIIQFFQKKCLDFSDPMFKILQNPQTSGGGKNSKKNDAPKMKKKCRTRGNGNAPPLPPPVTKVTPPWIS